MKISKIDTTHLRNNIYFKFHTEFRDLVVTSSAEALKIELQFNYYLPLYDKMNEAFRKIIKSEYTAKIHDANKARCEIWDGMTEINYACLKHFDPKIKSAAERLEPVFNGCGNVTTKLAKDATAVIKCVLQKLQDNYEADLATVGIHLWVEELRKRNAVFETFVKLRFDEAVCKSFIVLKKARVELDVVYRAIVDKVNALMVVEGEAAYEHFATELNNMISNYAMKRQKKTNA